MKNKRLNILLADDDMDDCIFFKQALEQLKQSTHLTTVNDGEQLMEMLTTKVRAKHHPSQKTDFVPFPDVIFLDINMPRKNGMECLAEIKANERLKDIPVVMFSTLNSRDKISMLFKTGAEVYIHKPGDFIQLTRVIHHALDMTTETKSPNNPIKYILNA